MIPLSRRGEFSYDLGAASFDTAGIRRRSVAQKTKVKLVVARKLLVCGVCRIILGNTSRVSLLSFYVHALSTPAWQVLGASGPPNPSTVL